MDLRVIEIDQGALSQALRHRPGFPVANDTAGKNKLVAIRAVEGEKGCDSIYYEVALAQLLHLVQAVKKQERPTPLQSFVQHGSERQVNPLVPVIIDDKAVKGNVSFIQGVGIGR